MQVHVYTALVHYLLNTEMQYQKNITKPITEISKYRNKIANIAIFSEWNIKYTWNNMKNLHKFAKEPSTTWIAGSSRYAILYRKCNIYRPNRTEVNFPKTTQP